jgi:DNA polymerase-3 subunit epsilon
MRGRGNSVVLDRPLVFVDIETDGLDYVRGHVIEVAAIRVEGGKIVRSFTSLVDPGGELPRFITNLTGIKTSDVRGAPSFLQIADELREVLDGAIFVAHNVRFDYSFLKQEYRRLGQTFSPQQLCTVRLSRALFPEYRSHKLQDLINRYGFSYAARHRAYDDAAILWQFIRYVRNTVAAEVVDAAVARQIRRPSLPKHVDPALIADLPVGPGVYIFEDEGNRPLYVGKSINIKKRVLQHFGNDVHDSKEFKITQTVHHISTQITDGELSALLLESRLVKELQPIYNRQLRRVNKLIVVRAETTENGHLQLNLEEMSPEAALTSRDTLATYPRRSTAKASLETLLRTYNLCPKLLGLEKATGACFWYQLGKCQGACLGAEPAALYNARLQTAFQGRKVESWPYSGPILVKETAESGIVVDDWCVLAEVSQQPDCEPQVKSWSRVFDLDTYKILQSFIGNKPRGLQVQILSQSQLAELGI